MKDEVLIPGYTDLKPIGRGGSAMVFSARQPQLERNVAIKVLRSASLDENSRRLFDAERRALGRLSDHASIVTVFDSGFTTNDEPYLVMQLCAGGSLSSLVRQNGPLSIEEAMRVGLKISQALEFAHRLGTLHRDVKPENILISDLGEPLLSDFGIAAVLENGAATSDGAMSPHYVAPEEFSGGRQSASTDLYSLGSTLFFLLTGRAPHQTNASERLSQAEVFSRVSNPTYPIDLPRSVDAPPQCRRAIQSILVKDRQRRLQDASMSVALFTAGETELETSGRRILLPVVQRQTGNEPVSIIEADPDVTVAQSKGTGAAQKSGASGQPAGSQSIRERKTGSSFSERDEWDRSPSDSLSNSGSFSDSNRVRRATAQPSRPPLSPSSFDAAPDTDPTVVALAGSKVNVDGSPLGTDPLGASGSNLVREPRSKAPILVGIGLVAAALGGLLFVVKPTTEPQTSDATETRAPELLPVAVATPIEVQAKAIGTTGVEVSWSAVGQPGIQYEVAMRRNNETVEVKSGAQPPFVFEGLDLSSGALCFEVSAVETSTNFLASAKEVCVAAPPTTLAQSVAGS
jgi:serine/threonine protein kinase